MKLKYLINSFYFQKRLFENYLSDYFEFYFSPGLENKRLRAIWYVSYNILAIKLAYWCGRIKTCDIVHFNRAEAFWLWHKIPGQVSIFEVHGFDIGVKGESYLKDLHSPLKRKLGLWLDHILEKRIKNNIQAVDIFYCSTPDLVAPIKDWCGREPLWLPNPIDINQFRPNGEKTDLIGKPACFLAARLHGDKKPEVAIEIFQKYIKPQFPEASLHLIATGELSDKYRQELSDVNTYFWHGYMNKDELASKLRGADLIFGDFSIGALSLLPMQAMALKKPIVTLDKYEIIKCEISELPELAIKILTDKNFAAQQAENNYQYITNTHHGQAVAKIHYDNLKNLNKLNLK